jgi:membrane associated rhomboid family serine protease
VSGNVGRSIGQYGMQMGLGPAVFTLLLINVGVFVLQFALRSFLGQDWIFGLFAYETQHAVYMGQIWRFFTYMFLHDTGGFTHLFFNMLGLWLFGSRLEALWGSRTFTWYYLLCGLGGGVLYGLVSVIQGNVFAQMVGASGAIFGILLAFGLAFPDAIIFVFFIPMRARIAVIVFGVISVVMSFGNTRIAHLAHLGGMVTGFLFLWLTTGGRPSQVPRLPRKRRRASQGWDQGYAGSTGRAPSLLERLVRSFYRWRTRLRVTVVDGEGGRSKTKPGNGSTGRRDKERVDEILEKISKEGLKSLTPEETEILRRASKKN